MNVSTNHKDFKLIAITPLLNCDKKFRKNLKEGIPYRFYNNYDIIVNKDKSAIQSVTLKQLDIPKDLYNLKNGININVSVVVGENGSGKSALMELFYYFIYAVSSMKTENSLGLETVTERMEYKIADLESVNLSFKEGCEANGISQNACNKDFLTSCNPDFLQFLTNTQNDYKLDIYLRDKKVSYIQQFENALSEKLNEAKFEYEQACQSDKFIFGQLSSKIQSALNVAVIYKNDNDIYVFELNKGTLRITKNNIEVNNFNFKDFFYSISLNYSHHSLNSKTLGGWINSLFHKNDGYTTPLVINPMRTEGMYDINHEHDLSKERLMFNLSYHLLNTKNKAKEYKLLDKYALFEVSFSIKGSCYPYPLGYDLASLQQLNSYFLIQSYIKEVDITDIHHFPYIIGYLERKLERIKTNYYSIIFKNFDSSDEEHKIQHFRKFISSDNSHITKKITRVVNYLRYCIKKRHNSSFNIAKFESKSITIQQFSDYINDVKNIVGTESELNVIDLMDYLPPSIFNIDFKLEDNQNGGNILLSELSSGEQQMIFNINTILYHLYNIQSTHSEASSNRLMYNNVLILLDEIELYYHPEMQKQILKNLLDSLELIKTKKTCGIKAINICFLTHSPFILSDIPSQNILKLKDGNPQKNNMNSNSFAANIYDILNDDFFLKNGAIGAFAAEKIKSIINKKNIVKEDLEVINLIGDPFLRGVIKKRIEDKISEDYIKKEIKRLNELLKNKHS